MKMLTTILSVLMTISVSKAVEIQGVKVPPYAQVEGQSLPLNGTGLRSFSLLLVPIKIYVASFYAPTSLRTEAEVLASSGPLVFSFTFLRAVSDSDVRRAWAGQFENSGSYTYSGYEKDRAAFSEMFGALQRGGVEMVQFVGTDTLVFDQGALRGRIKGRNFQKAFISMWFGSNPVSPDLKTSLLGS